MKRNLKRVLATLFAGGLLTLAGCVLTSVYPYYTAKDLVFEKKLVGRWMPAESEGTNDFWEFSRADTNLYYTLTMRDGNGPKTFQAHLFRLKQRTFLDALPTEEHDDFVPPHYLLQVVQSEPTLKMTMLNPGWVDELLEKEPEALRHIHVAEGQGQKRLVLTANTAELQKFILKHADNTNAFREGFVLERER